MRRELTAQVGADGVLTLTLDPEDANKSVRVIVETVEKAAAGPAMSREEWERFLDRTAGGWLGDFVREPEGKNPSEGNEP